jgi:predicted transcriptional regulator
MVAGEDGMTVDTAKLTELDPTEIARALVQEADKKWLSEFTQSLGRHRARDDFGRFSAVWGLSQSAAAGLFGVSRQAIGKWLSHGVPKNRIEAVANLSAATDLLVRYLKRNRIPAVVRRSSTRLRGGKSLLDLVGAGRTREVLIACREMFNFGDTHA